MFPVETTEVNQIVFAFVLMSIAALDAMIINRIVDGLLLEDFTAVCTWIMSITGFIAISILVGKYIF